MKKNIINLLICILLTVNNVYAQGGPGGQGPPDGVGGGPPTPPPNYCQQFPDDPGCVQIPIGADEWMLIFASASALFFLWKYRNLIK